MFTSLEKYFAAPQFQQDPVSTHIVQFLNLVCPEAPKVSQCVLEYFGDQTFADMNNYDAYCNFVCTVKAIVLQLPTYLPNPVEVRLSDLRARMPHGFSQNPSGTELAMRLEYDKLLVAQRSPPTLPSCGFGRVCQLAEIRVAIHQCLPLNTQDTFSAHANIRSIQITTQIWNTLFRNYTYNAASLSQDSPHTTISYETIRLMIEAAFKAHSTVDTSGILTFARNLHSTNTNPEFCASKEGRIERHVLEEAMLQVVCDRSPQMKAFIGKKHAQKLPEARLLDDIHSEYTTTFSEENKDSKENKNSS